MHVSCTEIRAVTEQQLERSLALTFLANAHIYTKFSHLTKSSSRRTLDRNRKANSLRSRDHPVTLSITSPQIDKHGLHSMGFKVQAWSIELSENGSGSPILRDLPMSEASRWWNEPSSRCVIGPAWTIEFLVVIAEDYDYVNRLKMFNELKREAPSLPFDAYSRGDMAVFNARFPDESTNTPDAFGSGVPFYSIGTIRTAVCWRWDVSRHLTRGWVLVGHRFGKYITPQMLDRLATLHQFRTNPLLPGLVVLEYFVYTGGERVGDTIRELQDVQVAIGYHNYSDVEQRDVPFAEHDLGQLAQKACTSAVSISTDTARMQQFVELSTWLIEEQCSSFLKSSASSSQGVLDTLEAGKLRFETHLQSCKRKAEQNLRRGECWKHNSTILLQTIYTLASQRDQQIGIQLAKDSKTLAEKATRDSTSMKAIAAVTMFFLPGTFVAVSITRQHLKPSGSTR